MLNDRIQYCISLIAYNQVGRSQFVKVSSLSVVTEERYQKSAISSFPLLGVSLSQFTLEPPYSVKNTAANKICNTANKEDTLYLQKEIITWSILKITDTYRNISFLTYFEKNILPQNCNSASRNTEYSIKNDIIFTIYTYYLYLLPYILQN